MARFFQAPVLQRADYAFQYPIDDIRTALAQEQQLQDESEAAANAVLDAMKQDTINQVEDQQERDRIIQSRYDQIDQMMYDESGNIRDMRNMYGQIQNVARNWAKETQTGGGIHAVATNLASQQANDEYIMKMQEAGDITAEHAQHGHAEARAMYDAQGGVGTEGNYKSYTPYIPAPTVDAVELAHEYTAGWQTDKIQKGNISVIDGTFKPSEEWITEMEKQYPDYIDVKSGHFQTGAMEFITMEEIYKNAQYSLAQNANLISYLKQEAEFKGGAQTPEEVAKYVEAQVHNAAIVTSEKYSKMHFDTKVIEDWKLKMQLRNRYNRQIAEMFIPKPPPMTVIESQGQSTVYNVDPNALFKQQQDTTTALQTVNDLLKTEFAEIESMAKSEKDLTPTELARYRELKAQQSDLTAKLDGYNNALNAVDKTLKNQGRFAKDGIGNDLFGVATTNLAAAFQEKTGMNPTIEDLKEIQNELMSLYSNKADLKAALESGDLAQIIPSYTDKVREKYETAPEASIGFFGPTVTQNKLDTNYDSKNVFETYNNNFETLNEVSVDSTEKEASGSYYSTTENNALRLYLDDITENMIVNGQQDNFIVEATGSDFVNIFEWADLAGVELPDKPVINTRLSTQNSSRGAQKMSVDVKDVNGKTYTIKLEAKRKAVNNLKQRAIGVGLETMRGAQRATSEQEKNHLLATGSRQIGMALFGQTAYESGMKRLFNLPKGKTGNAILYKNGVPAYQVTKTPKGGFVILMASPYGNVIEDVDHRMMNNPDSFVKDTRAWGNPGAYYFTDENAIYEVLGERHSIEELNVDASFYDTRVTAPIGRTGGIPPVLDLQAE